jgi:hypothetical protein
MPATGVEGKSSRAGVGAGENRSDPRKAVELRAGGRCPMVWRKAPIGASGMNRTSAAGLVAAGLLAACTSAIAQSAINAPRFYDPRVRCHDAPHASASNAEFAGRISVLPGRICLVRQATPRGSDMRLITVEVVEPPEFGRVTRPNGTSYAYRAPRGEVMDEFAVRLIYEGPDGSLFSPVIRYEVRVGR